MNSYGSYLQIQMHYLPNFLSLWGFRSLGMTSLLCKRQSLHPGLRLGACLSGETYLWFEFWVVSVRSLAIALLWSPERSKSWCLFPPTNVSSLLEVEGLCQ